MAKGKLGKEGRTDSEKVVMGDVKQRLAAFQKQLQSDLGIDIGAGVDPYRITLYTTGILNLDDALGGGLPVGMMTELYGEEQSGKTLIALLAMAEMQRSGKACLYIDAEFRFNPAFAEKLGVNVDPSMLTVIRKNVVQVVFQTIKNASYSRAFGLIVLDSIGALVSQEVMEMNMTKDAMRVGGSSKALTECSKAVMGPLSESGTSLIMINQVRDWIGAPVAGMKHKTGGNFISHAGAMRIRVKKPSTQRIFWDDDVATGVEIECEIEKSGLGANFREASFRHVYATGLDKEYDLLSLLYDKGVITLAGSFYNFNGTKFQGFDALLKAARTDAEFKKLLLAEAERVLRQKVEPVDGNIITDTNK